MISKGKTVKLIYALKFKHICMDHAHTHTPTHQSNACTQTLYSDMEK